MLSFLERVRQRRWEPCDFLQVDKGNTLEGVSIPESASSTSRSSSGDSPAHATALPTMNTLPRVSKWVADHPWVTALAAV